MKILRTRVIFHIYTRVIFHSLPIFEGNFANKNNFTKIGTPQIIRPAPLGLWIITVHNFFFKEMTHSGSKHAETHHCILAHMDIKLYLPSHVLHFKPWNIQWKCQQILQPESSWCPLHLVFLCVIWKLPHSKVLPHTHFIWSTYLCSTGLPTKLMNGI